MGNDEFEAFDLRDQSEKLMQQVMVARAEAAGFVWEGAPTCEGWERWTNETSAADHVTRLLHVAYDLQDQCEVAIAARRDYLEACLNDPTLRDNDDLSLEWHADQIERIELCLVRVKTAVDMLRLIG